MNAQYIRTDIIYACFICGYENSGAHTLFVKQVKEGYPYFPFLESHKLPTDAKEIAEDGSVQVCLLCFTFLNCQWESYERLKVSQTKRIYWLKRVDKEPFSGVMVGLQSEYASQFLGLSSDQLPAPQNVDENLICLKNNNNEKQSQKRQLEQTEALDLSLGKIDEKNLSNESELESVICYICGSNVPKSVIEIVCAQSHKNIPTFPQLFSLARQSGANPMDVFYNIEVCKSCSLRLHYLYTFYSTKNILEFRRNYYFNGHHTDNKNSKCYVCNTFIYSYKIDLTDNISKGKNTEFFCNDKIELCCKCLKSICNIISDNINCISDCKISKQLKYNHEDLKKSGHSKRLKIDSLCSICKKTFDPDKLEELDLETEFKNLNEQFASYLKSLSMFTSNNQKPKYFACNKCFKDVKSLQANFNKSSPKLPLLLKKNQLETKDNMEEINVSEEFDSKKSSFVSVRIGKNDIKFSDDNEPLLDDFECKNSNKTSTISLPYNSIQNPLNISTNCFICNSYCKPGTTYLIWTYHEEHNYFKNIDMKYTHPKWPNRYCGLVCTFCYHSLACQWQEQKEANVEEEEFNYDPNAFSCYVCNALTYRTRVHMLAVREFPFLLDHNAKCAKTPIKGTNNKQCIYTKGIIANGGCTVIVCRDCYETFYHQYLEMERLGVPIEKRQYNWIKRPPPPPSKQTLVPMKTFPVNDEMADAGSTAVGHEMEVLDICSSPPAAHLDKRKQSECIP